MGCGASSKKYVEPEAGVSAPVPEVKDQEEDGPATAAEVKAAGAKEDSGGVLHVVESAVLDVAGFAAVTVGGATAMVAHGVATAALTVADCATLGMIDSLGDARDEEFKEMVDGRDDAAAGFKCHTNTEFYRGEACCDMSDWMAAIPDDTQLTTMWIPGTHDTLSDNGGDIAECQGWNLKQQLESGVRVFDIRFKHVCDKLCGYHGIINLYHEIEGVVSDLEEFLTQHPKEAVFARVKQEGSSGEHSCKFHEQFMKFTTKPELWNFEATSWTNLSSYRGKITLVAFGSALLLYKQPLDIQDEYNTGDEDKKFDYIMQHAGKERSPDTLSINFCSAVGLDGWTCFKAPGAMAYQVNKMVFDAKDKLTPGCYLFDFPGNSLLKAVIARNQPPHAAS